MTDPDPGADDLGRSAAPLTSTTEAVDAVARALDFEPVAPVAPVGSAARVASVSGASAAPAPEPAASLAPRRGSAPPPSEPSRFWRYGFPAVMVVLAMAIVALSYVGKQTVLKNTDGKLVTEIVDPAAPGYRAVTAPTPTMLVVQADANGEPNGLTVMSLTGDGDGALIFIPMNTGVDLPGQGPITMSAAARNGGIDGVRAAVEQLLGAGMTESAVVSPEQWSDVVAGVGTLSIENPDDVTVLQDDGTNLVIVPRGTVTLAPDDVAPYLATTNPGESDLNRLVRHRVFWDAWLHAVGTSTDPAVVPGETGSGLGRFVLALAHARVEMEQLPVQILALPNSDAVLYVPIEDQVRSLVAKVVPFPIGAPVGSRPRVRLLDGVGSLQHGVGAAPLIVEGGGQIDQIGNADAFGEKVTHVYYIGAQWKEAADVLQKALGVGQVVEDAGGGSLADITIVLGADYSAQPPRSINTVNTAPVGTATTTIVGVQGG